MDGFGSRWTPGGLIGAMHPTAGRSSVIPNDCMAACMGGDRARAGETGHAAHVPQGPRPQHRGARCAGANDVQANVYAAPTVRGEMGSSAGDERAPRSRSNRAGRCPHRATREWEGQEGAGAQVAEGGQTAQEELDYAARLDVRKNVRGPSCAGSETGFGAIRPRPVAANWVSVQFRRSRWQRNGFRCSDLKTKGDHCSK